jgi:diaminopropionate ammonia-lyase
MSIRKYVETSTGTSAVQSLYAPFAGKFSSKPVADESKSHLEYFRSKQQAVIDFNERVNMVHTPLLSLPKVAETINVKQVLLKDEGKRLGLKAFKGAGVGFAIDERIKAVGHDEFFKNGADTTITTMTDGNHGRAVANYAKKIGAKCVIFVPNIMSTHRRQAIENEGAEVVVVDGDYDDSIDEVVAQATAKNWHMILDTAFEGYEAVPSDIVSGYGGTIFEEVTQQLEKSHPGAQITHLVLCAGVGSFASGGAMAAYTKIKDGSSVWSPSLKFVVVEPGDAACLLENVQRADADTSANDPAATTVTVVTTAGGAAEFVLQKCTGKTESLMAGLNCGVPSTAAFPILRDLTDVFVSVSDDYARKAVRLYHQVR